MKGNARIFATLVATAMFFAGCSGPSRTPTRVEYLPPVTPVSVRFVTPDEPEFFTETESETSFESRLVAGETYEGFAEDEWTTATTTTTPRTQHVALWGGPFEAADVTYSGATLTPGTYLFAVVDPEQEKLVEGWMEVNFQGNDILDVLYAWKESIPQQKQRLIYSFDVTGRMYAGEDEFAGFSQELDALNRLEQRINETIRAEQRARSNRGRDVQDFLHRAEILLLPAGDQPEVFAPTTLAAFSEEDLETVIGGDAVTRIVLVADYDEAQWKMRRINELFNDLERYRAVLRETSDRLERRKGLFLLTDHLHQHDKRFLENEKSLANVHAEMERVEQQMNDLRSRRMALAFVTELVAPEGSFEALKREQDELLRERAVLQAQKRRFDIMFTESAPNSVKRVAFERSRQRVSAGIERLDRQIGQLNDARHALAKMSESTQVIHRQGDKRLLTTTFVGQNLPFPVRTAVEREAVMTVRLEGSDRVFVPETTTVTTRTYEESTVFGAPTDETGSWDTRPATTVVRQASDQNRTLDTGTRKTTATPDAKRQEKPAGTSESFDTVTRQKTESRKSQDVTPDEPGKKSDDEPGTTKDDWPADPGDDDTASAWQSHAYPASDVVQPDWPTDEQQVERKPGSRKCKGGFLVKLLVPPCWFLDKD